MMIETLEGRRLFSGTLILNFNGGTDPNGITTPAWGTAAQQAQVVAQVAEAFSPFSVNVTASPVPLAVGVGVIEIGGDGAWDGGGEGGVTPVLNGARTNPVNDANVPTHYAYVFPAQLLDTAKYVADAVIHESGHLMAGIVHHPQFNASGNIVNDYDPGNGVVGPFMGAAYFDTRGLWYSGLNDSEIYQDDQYAIAHYYGNRPDAIGQTFTSATPIVGNLHGSGVIEQTTDGSGNITASTHDTYTFTETGASRVHLSVGVAAQGAMLHAQEWLYDGSGRLLANANAATLGQTINMNLPAGKYYLVVGSYGGYGDIGSYSLSGSLNSIVFSNGNGITAPTFPPDTLGSVVSGLKILDGDSQQGNNSPVIQ